LGEGTVWVVLAISRSRLGCMSGSSETVDGERAWPHR
jgi:hypothetical protein